MAFFLCRLTPPRPSFPMDMNDEERAIMNEHFEYWRGLFDDGVVIVYGPVADPAGAWGVSVVEAGDEAEVQAMVARDPVKVRGGDAFRYDVLPMPAGFARSA